MSLTSQPLPLPDVTTPALTAQHCSEKQKQMSKPAGSPHTWPWKGIATGVLNRRDLGAETPAPEEEGASRGGGRAGTLAGLSHPQLASAQPLRRALGLHQVQGFGKGLGLGGQRLGCWSWLWPWLSFRGGMPFLWTSFHLENGPGLGTVRQGPLLPNGPPSLLLLRCLEGLAPPCSC